VKTHPAYASLSPLFAYGAKREESLSSLNNFSSVSRTASGESRQNMLACAAVGALANLAGARE